MLPLLAPTLGMAQGRAADPLPAWRLGGYVGLAFNSPGGNYLGSTTGRDHLFLGIRAAASILHVGPLTIAYAAEFLPAVIVWPNPKYATLSVGSGQTILVERGSGPVWGVGLTPLGLEGHLEVLRKWSVFAAGGVGFVRFTRAVPVVYSRAHNYTFEYGGGVFWEYQAGHWLQAGFKFHHLSNLYTAPANPGLDANLFYLGWHYRVSIGARRAT